MPGQRVFTLVALAGLLSIVSPTSGQSLLLDLPRDCQHATVIQRVGITDIIINYHRPMAKGRQIWGKLVPYGEVWRAGANENTTITFIDDVTIEGLPLAKGVYGLYMIPNENEWTVIFSKIHTDWGSYTYDPAHDALRVKVRPQPCEMREALDYEFDDVTPDSTTATMRWEKRAVSFKINLNVHDIVRASLPLQLHGGVQYSWNGWDDAANYLLSQKFALEDALKYEDSCHWQRKALRQPPDEIPNPRRYGPKGRSRRREKRSFVRRHRRPTVLLCRLDEIRRQTRRCL